MPIADDLRTIADRANRDLDAAHDFYVHSKAVWTSLESLVTAGHAFSSVNPATGSTVDGPELVRLAPEYISDYLAAFTFRQFVSTFESFFFAFYHRLLLHNPRPFAKSQLDLEVLLNARDREEAISSVLLKQIDQVKYEKVRDWFVAMNKATKLGCPTDDEADALAEIKATRDILEHNDGVVNDVYVRKAGKKARYAVGAFIEIEDSYHLASWQLIKKVIADLTAAAAAKLAGP